MSHLDNPDVLKMSQRFDNHKPYLLLYLDWLGTQLSPLRAELHTYNEQRNHDERTKPGAMHCPAHAAYLSSPP